MAEVIPYPLSRRVGLIRKQARWYLEQGERGAEKNLKVLVRQQESSLLAKGVAPEVAEAEAKALEGAIRAMTWHMVIGQGGAA